MKKTATVPGREHFKTIADIFTVLSDPTRLMILHLLKQQPAYVADIVIQTGLKQPNVSKHLAMLYHADLVSRERHGNQIRYWIEEPLVFDLCGLVCGKLHRDAETQKILLRRVSASQAGQLMT